MIIRQVHSGKEHRETIDIDDASSDSFDLIEDDGERADNQSTQDDIILSNSIVNLNIK
jgi:hypothetical protein